MSARNHAQLPSTLSIYIQSHFKNSLNTSSPDLQPTLRALLALRRRNWNLGSFPLPLLPLLFFMELVPPAPSRVPPQHRISGGGTERSRGGWRLETLPGGRRSTSLRCFPPLPSGAALGLLGISQLYRVRLHIPDSICRSRGWIKSLNSILL